MGSAVQYSLTNGVATIRIDDGKVNALSLEVQAGLREALERSASDDAPVLLGGNSKAFSAGFDLGTLREGGERAEQMFRGGFELAATILRHPTPVVVECTGHAMAMGVFMLLCGDVRVGSTASYKITANEVMIGFPVPRAAIEIMRSRLTPAAIVSAAALGRVFTPDEAVHAGFLDRIVDTTCLHDVALQVATDLRQIPRRAHQVTKSRLHQPTVDAILKVLDDDVRDLRRSR